jgi:Predicted membrane protein (DUF2232)
MLQYITIALAAGIASVLLAAVAQPGTGTGMLLATIAPLPLMIAGFGWHPLMAALGGLLTSAILAIMFRGSAGIMFMVMVTVPAYLAASAVWKQSEQRWPAQTLIGLLCAGAAFYAAALTTMGAMSISFDYATLQARLLQQAELVFRFMTRTSAEAPLPQIGGQDASTVLAAFANAVAPATAVYLALVYMLNIWLAAKIASKSGRLPIQWTPVREMRLPRWMLPVSAVGLLLGNLGGYPGFVAELIGFTGLTAITAAGYAALHHALVGSELRILLLTVVWALTLFLGFPVALMLLAGIAELAFGWRDKVLAKRNSQN